MTSLLDVQFSKFCTTFKILRNNKINSIMTNVLEFVLQNILSWCQSCRLLLRPKCRIGHPTLQPFCSFFLFSSPNGDHLAQIRVHNMVILNPYPLSTLQPFCSFFLFSSPNGDHFAQIRVHNMVILNPYPLCITCPLHSLLYRPRLCLRESRYSKNYILKATRNTQHQVWH